MTVDQQRYTVYGTAMNAVDEPTEIGSTSLVAARLHAAAFTIEGRDVYIFDCIGNKRVALSAQKEVMQ